MDEKYSFTDEHRAQLKPWADKWLENAFSTQKMGAKEVQQSKERVVELYVAAKLPPPDIKRVVHVPSTMIGAIVWGVAAGLVFLKKNPQKHAELFDRELTAGELQLAREQAVEHCCQVMFGDEKLLQLATAHQALDVVLGGGLTPPPAGEVHKDAKRFLVGCVSRWPSGYNAGKDWSGWPAFLSFFRHVVKLPLDYTTWAPYEELSKVGPRFMHEEFAVLCDRQLEIHVDPENLPHNEFGAAIIWRCGTKAYYWHGTSIPAEWIEKKAELQAFNVMKEENMEKRRAGCEILFTRSILP